jgi:hypothetical protein
MIRFLAGVAAAFILQVLGAYVVVAPERAALERKDVSCEPAHRCVRG